MTPEQAMPRDEAVNVLSTLIHVSEDGRKGFTEAADKVDDANLKVLLSERAQECGNAVRELTQCVRTLGGQAPEGGTVTGALHRGWVKMRASVTDARLAVLEEAERGEDYAKAAYAKAVKSALPPEARTLVERQQQGVLRNHDRIRDLRDRHRAAA
ncbi:PA2169 family four-helix-bundle protein [Panacagrimonas sp.]|uniref:PA2169 family four-helix-bundle protein n=1 Tax=Panacagrimonas sp. TaxID=2480088 RepID=UPI003B52226F